MAQKIINTGSSELAGDGESIRSAFTKINDNFTELYDSNFISVSSLKDLVSTSVDFEDFKNKISNL